ncbi:MAG: chitobiase/beta-hexosaminidase C-terminal domain-containing protein [Prevotella sp.]|nr:chitobiase/beta-hexosaminidase C-terminal domain-containing protein [Prevotella sp.]
MKKLLITMACIISGCVASNAQESITPPNITPGYGKSFFRRQQISFSCKTDGAKIYYTIDGNTPTAASTEYSEDAPLYIDKTTTIKAIAVKGDQKSDVSETICKKDLRAIAIVAEYGDKKFAMGKSKRNNTNEGHLAAQIFTERQTYTPSAFTNIGWFFKSDGTIVDIESRKYLSFDAAVTQLSTTNTKWEITDNNEIRSIEDNRTIGYETKINTDGYFGAYKDPKTAAHPFNINKGAYRTNITERVFGTWCLPYDVAVGDRPDATYYNILGKKTEANGKITLYLIEETGTLKAGVPHIVRNDKKDLYAYYLDEVEAITTPPPYQNVNGLIGKFEDGTEIPKGMYIIYENRIRKCGTGCTVNQGYAYINMDDVPEINESKANANRAIELSSGGTTAIDGINETNTNNLYYNLQGQRVASPRKGLYIVNGKKMIIR